VSGGTPAHDSKACSLRIVLLSALLISDVTFPFSGEFATMPWKSVGNMLGVGLNGKELPYIPGREALLDCTQVDGKDHWQIAGFHADKFGELVARAVANVEEAMRKRELTDGAPDEPFPLCILTGQVAGCWKEAGASRDHRIAELRGAAWSALMVPLTADNLTLYNAVMAWLMAEHTINGEWRPIREVVALLKQWNELRVNKLTAISENGAATIRAEANIQESSIPAEAETDVEWLTVTASVAELLKTFPHFSPGYAKTLISREADSVPPIVEG
jgi:hypothetical protein